MIDNVYQQAIIDEAQNPRNQGNLEGEVDAKGFEIVDRQEVNASCGDEVTVSLKLSVDKKTVKDIKWIGHGCVVSQASMSVFSEKVKGAKVAEVLSWNKQDLFPFFGMKEISAGREKCFMMGLRAVQRALG